MDGGINKGLMVILGYFWVRFVVGPIGGIRCMPISHLIYKLDRDMG